jgi:branched-chain amino acid aminotransferase
VEREAARAAPGGVGAPNPGANSAAGSPATWGARDNGYAEVLFLDAREKRFVNESGSSNFYGITRDGKYVTPKSPSILASITNKSLMEMARDMGITVEQREVLVDELPEFVEAGLVGTATIIAPVYEIQYRDRLIRYCGPDQVGPVSAKLRESLVAVQAGDAPDPHGWMHEIKLD